jgi:hypothetical protein
LTISASFSFQVANSYSKQVSLESWDNFTNMAT